MKAYVWSVLGAIAVGCGAGEGTVNVTAYGETFIEQGIAADDTADGWAVTFDRFVVDVRDVVVADVSLNDPGPIDLTQPSDGGGQSLGSVTAAEDHYQGGSFVVASLALSGAIFRGDVEKEFDWVFPGPTLYTRCDTSIAVNPDATATFQITIHADHFFHDSLVAAEPSLLIGPLVAADVDHDDVIAPQELMATGLGAYDPGNQDIDDLWTWLATLSRTVGHANGEGHCQPEALGAHSTALSARAQRTR